MKAFARLFRFVKPRTSRGRVLLWATLVSLVLGGIGLGLPLEELLRAQRNRLHRHPASQQVVMVTIDDRSINEIGRYPWPRSRMADLVGRLDRMGARQIFMNLVLAGATDPEDDRALGKAMQSARRPVVLAAPFGPDQSASEQAVFRPPAELEKRVLFASMFAMTTPWHT